MTITIAATGLSASAGAEDLARPSLDLQPEPILPVARFDRGPGIGRWMALPAWTGEVRTLGPATLRVSRAVRAGSPSAAALGGGGRPQSRAVRADLAMDVSRGLSLHAFSEAARSVRAAPVSGRLRSSTSYGLDAGLALRAAGMVTAGIEYVAIRRSGMRDPLAALYGIANASTPLGRGGGLFLSGMGDDRRAGGIGWALSLTSLRRPILPMPLTSVGAADAHAADRRATAMLRFAF